MPMKPDALPSGFGVRTRLAPSNEWLHGALVLATMALLYAPTLLFLAETTWSSAEQSYGPVLLLSSLWLFWQRREALMACRVQPRALGGYGLLAIGLFCYALGRSQGVLVLEAGSLVPVALALVLLYRGWPGVKVLGLPLVLLVFVAPLPSDVVTTLTGPLKSAVSAVAADVLYWLGYPVARTGVMLRVGQYELLVADACAGLTSMFTLEAIGLVYMGIRNHPSVRRNVTLGLLLVPIAFVANVIRVLILVLVTYYFGDEAGQGFVHDAAGIVLFMVATGLMLAVDTLLDYVQWRDVPARKP